MFGAQSRGKDLAEGVLNRIGDELAFGGSDDEWRRKENVVAALSIDAALCRIDEDIFLERSLTDYFRDARFLWKWLTGGFVFHEFDGLQQAEAAHLADVGMRFQV